MGSGMCIRGVRGRGLGLRGKHSLFFGCIIVGGGGIKTFWGVESLRVVGYVYVRNAFFFVMELVFVRGTWLLGGINIALRAPCFFLVHHHQYLNCLFKIIIQTLHVPLFLRLSKINGTSACLFLLVPQHTPAARL